MKIKIYWENRSYECITLEQWRALLWLQFHAQSPASNGTQDRASVVQAEEEDSSVKRIGAHLQATAIEKRKRYNIASVMTVRPQRSQLVLLSFP